MKEAVSDEIELSDFDVAEIKKINYDLVHKLKASDNAFSLGMYARITHKYPYSENFRYNPRIWVCFYF